MTDKDEGELARIISGLIKDKGPITFAQFMELALYHPQLGYYRAGKEVWGGSGDYVTNADAGAVFTKLFARQIEQAWRELSCPDDFTLVEAGGGRGLILKGIARSLEEFYPALYDLIKLVVVELSDRHSFSHLDGKAVDWYNDLKSVGKLTNAVIFTNELLDALPFHRVVGGGQASGGALKELYVGIDDSDNGSGGFIEIIGAPSSARLSEYFDSLDIVLAEGQETEVSLNGVDWIKEAGALLNSGFVVTIDYGFPARELFTPDRPGTLLCHYRHTINDDPYSLIGQQDITAHVDFTSVVKAGRDSALELTGFTNQLSFLMGLGIAEELREVTGNAVNDLEAIRHNQSIKELIMPGGVGENFKVLVQHKGIEAPSLSGFSFRDRKHLLQ